MPDTTSEMIGRMIQAPCTPRRATLTGSITRPPVSVREMLARIIAPAPAPRILSLDIPIAAPPEEPVRPAAGV